MGDRESLHCNISNPEQLVALLEQSGWEKEELDLSEAPLAQAIDLSTAQVYSRPNRIGEVDFEEHFVFSPKEDNSVQIIQLILFGFCDGTPHHIETTSWNISNAFTYICDVALIDYLPPVFHNGKLYRYLIKHITNEKELLDAIQEGFVEQKY